MARYFLPEVVSPTQRRLYGKPVGSGLRAWDYQVSSILYKDLGQRIPRQFLLMLEYFGSGLLIPLAFILWAVPLSVVGAYFKAFCLNLLLGFFTDLALVGALKGLVRRPRPNYNDAGDFILVVNVDRYSFPSGHASRAVFIAVLSSVWRLGPWWVRWLVWWAALATAMSRVLMGRHYFTDVAAGVLVGIVNGLVVTKVSKTIRVTKGGMRSFHFLLGWFSRGWISSFFAVRGTKNPYRDKHQTVVTLVRIA